MDVRLSEEEARYPAARADLARGLITYGTGAQRVELARVRGMEVYDFDVNYQVDVTGSDRDETIRIDACRSTVKAGAGRDTLLLVATGTEYCFEPASGSTAGAAPTGSRRSAPPSTAVTGTTTSPAPVRRSTARSETTCSSVILGRTASTVAPAATAPTASAASLLPRRGPPPLRAVSPRPA